MGTDFSGHSSIGFAATVTALRSAVILEGLGSGGFEGDVGVAEARRVPVGFFDLCDGVRGDVVVFEVAGDRGDFGVGECLTGFGGEVHCWSSVR